MPLPTPNKDESEKEFVSRCMGNPIMNSEYSDEKQRTAVCYSQWHKKEGDSFSGIEETEDFIHYRVKEPDAFETCRITDFDGKLPGGVRAKYCKYKGKDEWAVQAYLFDKNKWDMDKARSWVNEHKQGQSSYSYFASIHSPFQKDGKYYALFRVITTKPSAPSIPKGERWRPSYESLRRCLGTILEAPLIGPPEKGHNAKEKMGKPVQWTMPDGYADVVYEILSAKTWEQIQKGAWQDVSPQVTSKQSHKEGDVTVLDDWYFEHVAFVDKGAFEDAEVLDWWQGDPKKWYTVAAEILGQAGNGETDVTGSLPLQGTQPVELPKKIGGIQKLTDENKPNEKPEPTKDNEAEVQKLQGEIASRDQKIQLLEKERDRPKETFKAELDRVTAELRALKDADIARKTAEQSSKAARLADLRIRSGLVGEGDRMRETEHYKTMQAEALDEMIAQFEVIASQVETGGPKAKSIENDGG